MSKKKIGVLVISVVMIVSAFVWYKMNKPGELSFNLKESEALIAEGHKLINEKGEVIFQTNGAGEGIKIYTTFDNKHFYTSEIIEGSEIHRIYRIDDLTKVFEIEEDISSRENIMFLDILIDDKVVFLSYTDKDMYSKEELIMEGLKGIEEKKEIRYRDGEEEKGMVHTADLTTGEVERIKNEDGEDIFTYEFYQNSNKDITTFALQIGYMYEEERDEKFLVTVVYDIEGREQFRYYAVKRSEKTDLAGMDTEMYFNQYNNLAYKDGLFGYINADGTMGIEYQYQNAGAFANGYAKVEKVGGERVMIDMEGNESPAYIEGNEIDVKLPDASSIAYNKDRSEYYYYNSANELLVCDEILDVEWYLPEGETFLINRRAEYKLIRGKNGVYTLDGRNLLDEVGEELNITEFTVRLNQYLSISYEDEEGNEKVRLYDSEGKMLYEDERGRFLKLAYPPSSKIAK